MIRSAALPASRTPNVQAPADIAAVVTNLPAGRAHRGESTAALRLQCERCRSEPRRKTRQGFRRHPAAAGRSAATGDGDRRRTSGLADGRRAAVLASWPRSAVRRLRPPSTRVRSPLERDEGEYAYAGQLILEGVPPYELAYNMKFPGAYYAYAALMAMFGETAAGIRIGLLCRHLVTMGVAVCAWPAAGRQPGGRRSAPRPFALLALDRWSMGIFAHATHFVLLPAVAGFLALHFALRTERAWMFVMSGVLMGVAIIMKQQALFFALPAVALAMWSARAAGSAWCGAAARWSSRAWRRRSHCSSPCSPRRACSTDSGSGRSSTLPRTYRRSLSLGMSVLGMAWARITLDNGWFWYAGVAGLALLFLTRLAHGNRLFIMSWLVASALAIVPGLYFRPHYFILLMPVAGLLVGVAIASIDRIAARPIGAVRARAAALLVFAGMLGRVRHSAVHYLFRIGETELVRSLYQGNPFLESPEVARYLAAHTTPDDRIVVLGSEPQIYFYSDRKSATGYIYAYP